MIAPARPVRRLAALGLVLALGLPVLGLNRLFPDPRLAREFVWVGIAALVLLWVTRVERQPLASIGFGRPTAATFGWGVATAVLLIASVMLTFAVIAPALGLHQNMKQTGVIVEVPFWLLLLTPVVAGVTEEIVYRGYAIERITLVTGSRAAGAVLAGAAFFLAHWSWGPTQLILVGFATVILTALYLWRRDLGMTITAHILADLVGFLLARAQM